MVFPKSSCMSLWLPIYSAVLQAWNYIITLTFPSFLSFGNHGGPTTPRHRGTPLPARIAWKWIDPVGPVRWSPTRSPNKRNMLGAPTSLLPPLPCLWVANMCQHHAQECLSITLCPTVGHSWSLKWCADPCSSVNYPHIFWWLIVGAESTTCNGLAWLAMSSFSSSQTSGCSKTAASNWASRSAKAWGRMDWHIWTMDMYGQTILMESLVTLVELFLIKMKQLKTHANNAIYSSTPPIPPYLFVRAQVNVPQTSWGTWLQHKPGCPTIDAISPSRYREWLGKRWKRSITKTTKSICLLFDIQRVNHSKYTYHMSHILCTPQGL